MESRKVDGLCDPANGVLSVAGQLRGGYARLILFHEIVHAIETAQGLHFTDHEVELIAAGLNSVPQIRFTEGCE